MTLKYSSGQDGIQYNIGRIGEECWERPVSCSALVMADENDNDGVNDDDDD